MLEKSDLDGQAVWKRVLKAVEEIQWQERREDEFSYYPCTPVNTSCAGMSPLSARGAGFTLPKARVWASLNPAEAIGQKWDFAQPRPDVRQDRMSGHSEGSKRNYEANVRFSIAASVKAFLVTSCHIPSACRLH